MKKRLLSVAICVFLLFVLIIPPIDASAAQVPDSTNREVVVFPDGSYMITEIYEEPLSTFRVSSEETKHGSKTSTGYSVTGEKLYSLTVHGSFTYDGLTAWAVSASYSYTVDSELWSFSGGSASCNGATATASGTFQCAGLSKTLTVSLTCSATGELS